MNKRYPNMVEYTALIKVAVNTNLKATVEEQLASVNLPSADELEWTKGEQPNPALAVLQYLLTDNISGDDDAMLFLNYWNEGEFDVLRNNWNCIPLEVFIGADSQLNLHNISAAPDAVWVAFNHVKSFYPELSYVHYDNEGRWIYAGVDNSTFNELTNIEILEKASDAVYGKGIITYSI